MSHMCKSHVTHVMSHVTRVQSHVTPSITWGEQKEQKRGMSRSKLGWNLPVFLSECFCMRRKYLYTYTVCKTAMDRSACHWLAVSVSTWKSSTHKINQVFGIYHVCRSSKVHVSMGKTWITPTANSSYNPPSTMRLHQMVSLCPCVETHFFGWGCFDCVPAFHLFSHESNISWAPNFVQMRLFKADGTFMLSLVLSRPFPNEDIEDSVIEVD